VAQELGRQWKEIDEEAKRKYEQMAQTGKSLYDAEMRDYKAGKRPCVNPGVAAGAGGQVVMANCQMPPQQQQQQVMGMAQQGASVYQPQQALLAAGGAQLAPNDEPDDDDDDEDDVEDGE